jgi:hypothetical protein
LVGAGDIVVNEVGGTKTALSAISPAFLVALRVDFDITRKFSRVCDEKGLEKDILLTLTFVAVVLCEEPKLIRLGVVREASKNTSYEKFKICDV